MSFTATIAERDQWTIIHLAGELDIACQADVAAVLDTAVAAGAERVVIDFAALTFIDTGGMGGILGAAASADLLGVDVVVSNPSLLAGHVLAVSGFRDVITTPIPLAS